MNSINKPLSLLYSRSERHSRKTKDRLDDLTLENTQLRKKFLSKSEEFSDYRASVESKSAKAILSYKEKAKSIRLSDYPIPLLLPLGSSHAESQD